MTVSELLDSFCEALELEEGALKINTPVASVEEWDSLGWISIIAVMDDKLGVRINAREVSGLTTAGEVAQYILEKSKAGQS